MSEPIETDEEFMDGISPLTKVVEYPEESITDQIVAHIYELFGGKDGSY